MSTFKNSFTTTFKPFSTEDIHSSQTTPETLYTLAKPKKFSNPTHLLSNNKLNEELNLTSGKNHRDIAKIFSGQIPIDGSKWHATRYGGHQFGHWAGQLGDGRAMTMGHWQTSSGNFEIQLKGAGPTVYSRRADGLAVLRSSAREYICSEYMHSVGVPTSRALHLISSGEEVLRDLLYDGNPKNEPGAILTRVAPSFLRFGSFEILAHNNETQLLKGLVHFVAEELYNIEIQDTKTRTQDAAKEIFKLICKNTARMIAQWMRLGFVHGVMNTDNMSVLGLTIDYGPYGWMERLIPDFTPNTSDSQNRYGYKNQPAIALWNLERLAVALSSIGVSFDDLEVSLKDYITDFESHLIELELNKLGFRNTINESLRTKVLPWVSDFYSLMISYQIDMTLFYKQLEILIANYSSSQNMVFEDFINSPEQKKAWVKISYSPENKDWSAFMKKIAHFLVLTSDSNHDLQLMRETNPWFIPRNYLLHQATQNIEKSNSKELLLELEKAANNPYDKVGPDYFYEKTPLWAFTTPGCSQLSCSS